LDLFLPDGKNWPVLVFVHGGGWDTGDKQLRVGGADVYGNIGRFYAALGIGVAVINYRLQPNAKWREQVSDVKTAVAWVQSNIARYGGKPDRTFLMGHSAGAHLASYVALTIKPEDGPPAIRGVIAVSGAALDISDLKTYQFGEKLSYYEKRFQEEDTTGQWKVLASPVCYVSPQAPPFLILYAGGEKKGLQRQSQVLKDALGKAGVESSVVVVPGESHSRMVLVLSHPGKTAAPAILAFIEKHT
jgi:acetyl esterase/lipase